MNCKRLTGHGQDEMMLHCPLCGASAGHLAVYMFDEKKLRKD
ncbi:hypothetical protein [Lactobacillus crispatus]|nr:hypothetical protein [Lactobacillus crispatus]STX15948.1 Uncharacterised protein [Lactobacillus acidophilus]